MCHIARLRSTDQSSPSLAGTLSSLWQVDIFPAKGQTDRIAKEVLADAFDLQLPTSIHVVAARGFLIQGTITSLDVAAIARQLLVEPVVEHSLLAKIGDAALSLPPAEHLKLVYVLPLPGVTDPEAESALMAIRQLGYDVDAVRTFRKYWVSELPDADMQLLCSKILCNDSIETIVHGKLELDELHLGIPINSNEPTFLSTTRPTNSWARSASNGN